MDTKWETHAQAPRLRGLRRDGQKDRLTRYMGRGYMGYVRLHLGWLALLALLGCTSGAIAPSGGAGPTTPSQPTRKTITVASLASYKGFGPQYVSTTGGGARQLNEIHSVGLLTTDAAGNIIGRL